MENEIRWHQRFSNYVKALTKLEQAVSYIKNDLIKSEVSISVEKTGIVLDEMIKGGLIQRFEYTHELAWNLMKDYAEFQGNSTIGGSRDSTREAFQLKLISDGHVWMDMIISRNKTSHTYNEETADEIYSKIIDSYFLAFVEFRKTMEKIKNGNKTDFFE